MNGETEKAETTVENTAEQPIETVMTKGEAIVSGLAMIEDGLKMIANLGNKYDLVKAIVGSGQAAERLRSAISDNKVMYNLVLNIVRSRNASNLSAKSVDRVVDDLLDTLFDLSRPYGQ